VPNKTWKSWEREVASWIGKRRNPLSGRNNVSDSGEERAGDIISDRLHIECKLRERVGAIGMMREERKKAKKPFVGVLREKRKKDLVCLVMDYDLAKRVLKCLEEGKCED